jgi:hypothetical protein
MNKPSIQSRNEIVCALNMKVDDVNSLLNAAEFMIAELSWRDTPEGYSEVSRQVSHVHNLLCIAKERAIEAVALGELADRATLVDSRGAMAEICNS